MFCEQCGKQLSETAKFCWACGAKVSPVMNTSNDSSAPEAAASGDTSVSEAGAAYGAAAPNAASASGTVAAPDAAAAFGTATAPDAAFGAVTAPDAASASGTVTASGNTDPLLQNPNLTFRVKCPKCGNVLNASRSYFCTKCQTQHEVDIVNNGFLYIYRMGHFSGVMAGMGIYLNREPMGHVANTGSALIELRPGTYNLHMAVSALRNCEDISITITPGTIVCAKAQIKMGMIKNKILLTKVNMSDMPPLG